jgi:RNA methyltransferase, TrmH family
LFLKPSKGQLKFLAGLDQGKIRRREGRFLAEGQKVVQEALRSPWGIDYFLVRADKASLWRPLLSTMAGKGIYELTEAEWKRISQDKESEGVAALMTMPRIRSFREVLPEGERRLLLLYQVGNPSNLGAILRSAHWFGVKTVLISEDSVDFTHPKVIRASMGSLFHLKIMDSVDFPQVLPDLQRHYTLLGTTVRGGVPPHPVHDKPSAILLGSESHGLPEEFLSLTDEQWCVPRLGDAESLSLPQATAILLYEWTKK